MTRMMCTVIATVFALGCAGQEEMVTPAAQPSQPGPQAATVGEADDVGEQGAGLLDSPLPASEPAASPAPTPPIAPVAKTVPASAKPASAKPAAAKPAAEPTAAKPTAAKPTATTPAPVPATPVSEPVPVLDDDSDSDLPDVKVVEDFEEEATRDITEDNLEAELAALERELG